jgi:peptidoglycan/LPS O-acetylase OafA/YrhL
VLLAVAWLTGSAGRGLVLDSIRLVVVVAAIVGLSMFVYRFYEAPAREWLRRLGARYAQLCARAEAPHSCGS